MEKVGFCMFSTLDGGQIRSRPMAATVRPEENAVWFLTDADSAKGEDVAAHPQVTAMSDKEKVRMEAAASD
jgi:general stress protein 26